MQNIGICFFLSTPSGGIFKPEDAKAKMDAGASLVQVWTGFIYEGPAIVKNILEALKK